MGFEMLISPLLPYRLLSEGRYPTCPFGAYLTGWIIGVDRGHT